ncbi:ATP-grasp domain-containing protein [Pannonibacter sp. SL95]|uniref:ATP-grasp domain-containing protein n=1 Tax=Pannonibacter sp. SL95 TaxID=2995153 RepID=UPI00227590C5|nr:ATP-grasp domain-containing protein [Pannonibacter sp. SL95]MCY1708689.1 ATP-grasp domain-containing protein [Pannonibacter sp. SL95]
MSFRRKRLLIVGPGTELYRGYILKSLRQKYDLVILSADEASWAQPFAEKVCYFDNSNPNQSIFSVSRALAAEYRIDGVLTCEERFVEFASAIAFELRLNGNSLETAMACRDKHKMRQRFAAASVPSAKSLLARTKKDMHAAAEEIGYPVVVKPRDMSGSLGVQLIDNQAELELSYQMILKIVGEEGLARKGVLIEEYLSGPEVSVECAVVDGKVEIVGMTHKALGFAPFFEELGHVVSPNNCVSEAAEISAVVCSAHAALGICTGVTHAELRLTEAGARMIEIALRLGGDRIPQLVHISTGVDLALLSGDIASRSEADFVAKRARCAAIRFVYPEYDCVVKSLPENRSLVDIKGVTEFSWCAAENKVHLLPPRGFLSRLALIVAEGETVSECEATLEAAMSVLKIDVEAVRQIEEQLI